MSDQSKRTGGEVVGLDDRVGKRVSTLQFEPPNTRAPHGSNMNLQHITENSHCMKQVCMSKYTMREKTEAGLSLNIIRVMEVNICFLGCGGIKGVFTQRQTEWMSISQKIVRDVMWACLKMESQNIFPGNEVRL